MRGSILVVGLLLFITGAGAGLWLLGRDSSQDDTFLDLLDNMAEDDQLSFVRDPAFYDEVEDQTRPQLSAQPSAALTKVVTRAGVAIHLPENLDLSPEGSPAPVQWFFSSGFDDGVDRVTGLRLSVGLYRDKSHYPHMLSTILTRVDDTTPSPSDPFTSFIFGGSVGGCPVFLPGPELPMGAVKVEKRATTDDLFGPREFNQRALIELYDGRFVEVALDGLPDVVPWSDQVRIFNTMVESVR